MRVFTVRTEKLFVVLLALCLCAATAFAQESWQGNAAIARSGEFSTPGLFAASNAFPKNARILVQNPQTGQSVQVTVAQRIPGAGNIFLLLTEEAGTQIGLTGSEVIRVRANVLSSLGTGLSGSLQEEAYSADPDLNPPMSIAEEQLQPEAPIEEEEVAAQAAPAGEEVEEEPIPEAEAPAASKEVEKTPEEKRLEELADRIPQKQLYMPPRQQEIYALAPQPSEAEEVEEEIAAAEEPVEEVAAVEETPEEPPVEEEEAIPEEEIVEVMVEEAAEEAVIETEEPRVSMLVPLEEQEDLDVALPGPEAVEPEKPSPEGSRLPFPEEESPLTVEPEEPPFAEEEIEVAEAAEPLVEEEPVAEIAMVESPSTPQEQLILSEILPSSSYFVQIGAYSTRSLAEKLAGDLTQTYSVTILSASSGGRQFYKVLVGPLNVDESGTLLYQFRSRGFKDAFIQYVE